MLEQCVGENHFARNSKSAPQLIHDVLGQMHDDRREHPFFFAGDVADVGPEGQAFLVGVALEDA